jgi:hypothetical protein
VGVRVSSDRTRATVGDRILVKVEVTHPPEVKVPPPTAVPGEGSTLPLEPVPSPIGGSKDWKDAKEPHAPVVERFFFQAQAFETGTIAVPAFRVDWQAPGGKSGSVSSQPIPIEIVSVLKGPQEKPADLKPPAELPPPPFPWKAAGIAALLLALLAVALFLWNRRKRRAPAAAVVPSGPPVPPHELAYRELERLLASGLLRAGKIKEFHVELAEIIKRYLAGRFGIDTREKTSEEVLDAMKQARVGTGPMGLVREFFAETDLVKFAKHLPREDEVRQTVDQAYRLVDLTKLVILPPVPAAGEAPPALSPEAAP